ncbi:uncharacterized protein L969DRAFT_92511 [Mixia osmundae IAM 14324]|uniref:Acyltransferase 3 domain-containing protein n=1 Tax=Mixia osmundae (strain CBS 9802 / IAM 14324 / JCM 22182 / KY 12970) TaxID=764103 RepID=G7DXB6_MIXOS|nr:uncharacterized protein L969DRAFT_92511 [Mixia osmundae IAM 14324]KEI41280.1 hypothetical protein L969DRAFT_92511 [Mixia osmundae IAM 14324]GAA95226.1 hypothetical protein E5Q_01882 [Mixia osmundae IAM 14324]
MQSAKARLVKSGHIDLVALDQPTSSKVAARPGHLTARRPPAKVASRSRLSAASSILLEAVEAVAQHTSEHTSQIGQSCAYQLAKPAHSQPSSSTCLGLLHSSEGWNLSQSTDRTRSDRSHHSPSHSRDDHHHSSQRGSDSAVSPSSAAGYPPFMTHDGHTSTSATLPRYQSNYGTYGNSTSDLSVSPLPTGGRNNPHPLSHALYADSSHTLGGTTLDGDASSSSGSDELRRNGANGKSQLGSGGSSYGTSGSTLVNGSSKRPSFQSNRPGRAGLPAYTRSNSYSSTPGMNTSGLSYLKRWSRPHLAGTSAGVSPAQLSIAAAKGKAARLGYLDGLRFILAMVALNGTFFSAVLDTNAYGFIQRASPLYIVRSFNLATTFLLVLLGRAVAAPLWEVVAPSAPSSSNTSGSTNQTVPSLGPSISWIRLTRCMLTRPFRFILPVIVVSGIQWALGATGKTADCNAVGMDEPYWSSIRNFAGYSTLIFNLFTYYEQDTMSGQTFAGNLWTAPWFFQASYAVYTIHMMLGNLSSNRYWVYGILAFFSWTTFNYFALAIIGLVFADMAAHGQFQKVKKWPMSRRLAVQGALIAVALIFQWVSVIRDNLNSAFATINVQNHVEITICDALFATCFLFALETSTLAQRLMGNVVLRNLGRLAPGLYLFAAPLTYTLVPSIAKSMAGAGSSASAITGVTWMALFGVALAISIPFYFFIELPSVLAGELFANLLESWGRDEDEVMAVKRRAQEVLKAPQPAPKKISGPTPAPFTSPAKSNRGPPSSGTGHKPARSSKGSSYGNQTKSTVLPRTASSIRIQTHMDTYLALSRCLGRHSARALGRSQRQAVVVLSSSEICSQGDKFWDIVALDRPCLYTEPTEHQIAELRVYLDAALLTSWGSPRYV